MLSFLCKVRNLAAYLMSIPHMLVQALKNYSFSKIGFPFYLLPEAETMLSLICFNIADFEYKLQSDFSTFWARAKSKGVCEMCAQ